MEKESELTTLTIRRVTRDRIEELKIHPNQSFDELLTEILDSGKVEEFKGRGKR